MKDYCFDTVSHSHSGVLLYKALQPVPPMTNLSNTFFLIFVQGLTAYS